MRTDVDAELHFWNKNVDEMIRLLQNVQANGVWSRQEAARHEVRLDSLRAQLDADFRELIALRQRVDLLDHGDSKIADRDQ